MLIFFSFFVQWNVKEFVSLFICASRVKLRLIELVRLRIDWLNCSQNIRYLEVTLTATLQFSIPFIRLSKPAIFDSTPGLGQVTSAWGQRFMAVRKVRYNQKTFYTEPAERKEMYKLKMTRNFNPILTIRLTYFLALLLIFWITFAGFPKVITSEFRCDI